MVQFLITSQKTFGFWSETLVIWFSQTPAGFLVCSFCVSFIAVKSGAPKKGDEQVKTKAGTKKKNCH